MVTTGQATAGTLTVEQSAGGTMISGEDNVARFRVLVLRGALELECQGIMHSRGSAYAMVKREFGFKGNKQRVLAQLNAWIEANIRTPSQA